MTKGHKSSLTFPLAIGWIACLFSLPFLLTELRGGSSIYFHTGEEIIATVMALVVGSTALARYYARPSNVMLLLGAGFIGTAFLDGFHAAATSATLAPYLPSKLPSLVSWSWVASRLLLALFLLACFVSLPSRGGDARPLRLSGTLVYSVTLGLTVLLFLFFSLVPLPAAHMPGAWMSRPQELIPGLIFAVALVFSVRSGRWKNSAIVRWVLIALVLSIVGQLAIMPFSNSGFDDRFDQAHLFKIMSYVAVFSGLLVDINEMFRRERLAQAELREKAQALEIAWADASAAAKAKTEFLAVMSHEIRTPLNGVLGMTELLRSADMDDEHKELLQYISDSGEALHTIINDILDFSKLEAGRIVLDPVAVDFLHFMRSCTGLMVSRAEEKGISLVVDVDDSVPKFLRVDQTRLRQVLLNLISNGIKFTHQGEVTLSVVALTPPGVSPARVSFEVKDSGIGISEQDQKNLFGKFTQADPTIARKFGGSGLGLSIVKQILALMNSDIELNSVEGRGSTFTFVLDLPIAERAERSSLTDGAATYQALRPLKVAVVDDNFINRVMLSNLLMRLGHSAVVFEGAQGYLAALDAEQPDVTLLDIRMPKMDGITAIKLLRSREDGRGTGEHAPVIACSADVISDFRDDDNLKGAFDGFLPKPVRIEELVAILEDVLDERLHRVVTKDEKAVSAAPTEKQPEKPDPEAPTTPVDPLDALLKDL